MCVFMVRKFPLTRRLRFSSCNGGQACRASIVSLKRRAHSAVMDRRKVSTTCCSAPLRDADMSPQSGLYGQRMKNFLQTYRSGFVREKSMEPKIFTTISSLLASGLLTRGNFVLFRQQPPCGPSTSFEPSIHHHTEIHHYLT